MQLDRRIVVGLGLASAVGGALAPSAGEARTKPGPTKGLAVAEAGLEPGAKRDQTEAMQRAIDQAAERETALLLAPGSYQVRTLKLRPGSVLIGTPGLTTLSALGGGPIMVAKGASLRLEGLVLDGRMLPVGTARSDGLMMLDGCDAITLGELDVRDCPANGIVLNGCSGSVSGCRIGHMGEAAIFSTDARGLEITANRIADCANNGILVWRTTLGEDGTIVSGNRIERIRAAAGGSGEHGNGVNVFRAGGVLVTGNRITDCAYTAVRGNAASDIQIVANSCQRLGEVAIYAEFGFEGALIASNLIDGAATGISVTNFNEGGRLAVIQGNLVRNLHRREHEPEDKRGDGICIEADSAVTGNTIENAPTTGIIVGWGKYMRDVAVTGNLVRKAGIGIAISSDAAAGQVLVAQNMLSGCRDGAIRASDRGRAHGPDLARAGVSGRITVAGNVAG